MAVSQARIDRVAVQLRFSADPYHGAAGTVLPEPALRSPYPRLSIARPVPEPS
jgi:hypothetical protein